MKKLLNYVILLVLIFIFDGCAKVGPLPDIAQPVIQGSSKKASYMVDGAEVKTGPEKDYEQDSDVIYRLTVNSSSILTKFFVATSSDVQSSSSHIVKTEPEAVIDASGKFIKNVNSVVVYYAYHIDPSVPISAAYSLPVTVTFNFQNEKNYTGTLSNKFDVIKKGSTSGNRLTVIDLPYANRSKIGLGCQRGINIFYGWKTIGGFITNRGGYFSLDYKQDIWRFEDAVTAADKIDLVGYLANTASVATRNPQIVLNSFNLVSPSDTTVISSKYAGALVAKIALTGGATTGGPHTLNITVNGVTKPISFSGTTTTTTAAAFVTANSAAYAAVGITLTNSAAVLNFNAINDEVAFKQATKIEYVSGTLSANDEFSTINPTEKENTYNSYQDLLYRLGIRDISANLASKGKKLRIVKFKRLDNLATADSVSLRYFDLLSHDNEFDKLLGDCAVNGRTVSGPVSLDQVWGFVMDNGRWGLIKTAPTQALDDATYSGIQSIVPVTAPNASPYTLFCTIKFSEKRK